MQTEMYTEKKPNQKTIRLKCICCHFKRKKREKKVCLKKPYRILFCKFCIIFWYRAVFTADSMSLTCLGPPLLHRRAWQLVLGVRADMLCLLFAFHRCALPPNIYSLVWSIQILLQSSCDLFRCNFVKLSCLFVLFFLKSFFLATFLNIKP